MLISPEPHMQKNDPYGRHYDSRASGSNTATVSAGQLYRQPSETYEKLPTEPVPEIWETYRELLNKYDKDDAFHDFEFIDRLPFYKTAEDAFVIVQTGDESRYGNIILQKGVC